MSEKPCGCDDPVHFSEDAEGIVTVRCLACNATWLLEPWLSVTVKRIQASEAIRLGRPLTPWEAHGIDDQCYFRTLTEGCRGPDRRRGVAMAASFHTYGFAADGFTPAASVTLGMTDPKSFEHDRRELEHALGAVREGWARERRDVDLLYSVEAVVSARSFLADRALSSAWFTLWSHTERPEFVETLAVLARALLKQHHIQHRVYQEVDRAREAALAVFQPPPP